MAIYLKDPNFIIGLRHVLVFATGIGVSQDETHYCYYYYLAWPDITSTPVVGGRGGLIFIKLSS